MNLKEIVVFKKTNVLRKPNIMFQVLLGKSEKRFAFRFVLSKIN